MQVAPTHTTVQVNPKPGKQLDTLAHELAQNSPVEKKSKQKAILLRRLQSWKKTLHKAYVYFRADSSKDRVFSRAGEWMLDNFYIVEQTFHQIEEDLPESYYNQLPKLDKTALKGAPRIFGLAWEWVGYNQSQLELTQTAVFVQDYQQVMPLTVGELWALPTMLRIAILERLTAAVAAITGIVDPEVLTTQPILPAPPLVANESIVANCFLSLRLLTTTNWKTFFEQTSCVEQILRKDPAEIYAGMDFDTRNQYRSVVEELARHSDQSEEAVAQHVIDLCRNPQSQSSIPRNTCRVLSD